MSPVRGKKAKSASKKKSSRPPRPAAKKRAAKPAKQAAKASKPAKATKPAAKGKAPATPERRHCVAADPFGDPCQSAPRLPSKYCTIHSYLDR